YNPLKQFRIPEGQGQKDGCGYFSYGPEIFPTRNKERKEKKPDLNFCTRQERE
ncbi:hypothetical protein P7K49_001298, partial [Saguinus oedipus]